jgi:hypothetical protein
MKLWADEINFNDFQEEYNPELVDERLVALLTPSIPFSVERHQVVYHNGIGFII